MMRIFSISTLSFVHAKIVMREDINSYTRANFILFHLVSYSFFYHSFSQSVPLYPFDVIEEEKKYTIFIRACFERFPVRWTEYFLSPFFCYFLLLILPLAESMFRALCSLAYETFSFSCYTFFSLLQFMIVSMRKGRKHKKQETKEKISNKVTVIVWQ